MNMAARNLMEQAYGIRGPLVAMSASWEERVGSATTGMMSTQELDSHCWPGLRSSRTKSERPNELMMRSLLADRFKLKVHVQSAELPIYALLVAKGCPKMTVMEDVPTTIQRSDCGSRAPERHRLLREVSRSIEMALPLVGIGRFGRWEE